MSDSSGLVTILIETWAQQAREGFLLSDPDREAVQTVEALDGACGVRYRFRWMPHRELRANVAELERRGILNPRRDEDKLFRDSRDPSGRHCFLCVDNIRECHPQERLVPMRLAGRDYFAGANFAWIERDHYTVIDAEHVDQDYSRHALEAMLDLHSQTDGRFRVLFNGAGAGATIPWHRHYQITTCPMPIEEIRPGREAHYPTVVWRFPAAGAGLDDAHAQAEAWLRRDPEHHSINILVATSAGQTVIFVFPRDRRRTRAADKSLVGGFEVAGDFVLSAPHEEPVFHKASSELARAILGQIRPSV